MSRTRDWGRFGRMILTGGLLFVVSLLFDVGIVLSGWMDDVPDDLRERAEINACFIGPIRAGIIARLARTHPPTEKRLGRLRRLEREAETGRLT